MSEIKPALTAEQWAKKDFFLEARLMMGGQLLQVECDDVVNGPHAVAAIALDGQPYGFTREMLAALQRTITDAHVMHDDRVTDADERRECEAQLDLADAVADCVEALLPPEGK